MTEPENPYQSPPVLEPSPTLAQGWDSSQRLNPFLSIWTQPRRTIRQIVDTQSYQQVWWLAGLQGIGATLDRASLRDLGDRVSLETIIVVACFLGPLGGWLSLWIMAHLLSWTGQLMAATGERKDIRAAVAWAMLPSVVALPLWLPQLILFGSDLFTSQTPYLDANPNLLIPFLAFGMLEITLGIWTLPLLCNTLAEVQGFRSAWSGLANLLLALVSFVLVILFFALIVGVVLVVGR